jgi:hypothetical protein
MGWEDEDEVEVEVVEEGEGDAFGEPAFKIRGGIKWGEITPDGLIRAQA